MDHLFFLSRAWFFLLLFLASGVGQAKEAIDPSVDVQLATRLFESKRETAQKARVKAQALYSDYSKTVRALEGIQAKKQAFIHQGDLKKSMAQALEQDSKNYKSQMEVHRRRILANKNKRLELEAVLFKKQALFERNMEALEQENQKLLSNQKMLSGLEIQKQSLQTQKQVLEKRLKTLEQQNSDLTSQILIAQKDIPLLQAQLARLQGDIQRCQTALEQNQASLSQIQIMIVRTEKRCDEISQRERELREKLAEVGGQIRALEKKASQAGSHAQDFAKEVSKLERQVQAAAQLITRLDTQMTQSENKIESFEAARLALVDENASLDAEISSLQAESARLEKRKSHLESLLAQAEDEEKKKDLQNKIQVLSGQITQAQTQASQKQRQVTLNQQQARQLVAQRRAERENLGKLRTQKSHAEDEKRQSLEACAKYVALQDEQEQIRDGALAQAQQVSQSSKALERQLEQAASQFQQASQRLQQLLADQRNLEIENTQLARQWETSTEEAQSLEFETLASLVAQLSRDELALDGVLAKQNQVQEQLVIEDSSIASIDREISQRQGQEAQSLAFISQLQSQNQTLEREIRVNSSEQVALVEENSAIESQILSLQSSIDKNGPRIQALLTQSGVHYNEALEYDGPIASAQSVVQIALDVFKLSDTEATTMETVSEKAFAHLTQVKSNYARRMSEVIAQAEVASRADSEPEAIEASQKRAQKEGQEQGTLKGTQEGQVIGQQKDYQSAFEKAFATHEQLVLQEKRLETPAEKKQRAQDKILNQWFEKAAAIALPLGDEQGYAQGNNPENHLIGYNQGYQAGKSRAYDQAQKVSRPKGMSDEEAKILSAPAENEVEWDFMEQQEGEEQEEEPLEGGRLSLKKQVSSLSLKKLTGLGLRLLSQWVPVAWGGAQDGVLSPEEVGEPTWSGKPATFPTFEHPDFTQAFDTSYMRGYRRFYHERYIAHYKSTFDGVYLDFYTLSKQQASTATYPDSLAQGEARGKLEGTFRALGYNGGYQQGFDEGLQRGTAFAIKQGHAQGQERGFSENIKTFNDQAYQQGVLEVQQKFEKISFLQLVEDSVVIEDENQDGKFEIGEKVGIHLKLRNFGGLEAQAQDFQVEVDPSSLQGARLDFLPKEFEAIGPRTQIHYKNTLGATVLAGGQFGFTFTLKFQDHWSQSVSVLQKIHAPYDVRFSDFYDAKIGLNVRTVGQGMGYHNAVWVSGLGDKVLEKGMEIHLEPQGPKALGLSWGGGKKGWQRLEVGSSKWIKTGFFLTAQSSQGLLDNLFRVRLRDAQGQILMDKTLKAPIQIRP